LLIIVTKFFAKPPADQPAKPVIGADGETIDPHLLPPKTVSLSWPVDGEAISMHVYLTTSPSPNMFQSDWLDYRKGPDGYLPSFSWENITFGDWKDSRVEEFEVKFPEASIERAA
jgi:hypothetical protein